MERLSCCIAGCRRSTRKVGRFAFCTEWICGPHWQLLPQQLRRVHNRHNRQLRRFGFYPRPAAQARIWQRIVALASQPDSGPVSTAS